MYYFIFGTNVMFCIFFSVHPPPPPQHFFLLFFVILPLFLLSSCCRPRSYYGDAVSANHVLSATHFEEMHTYRLNWQPGTEDRLGFLEWHVDDEMVYSINDDTLVS